MKECYYRLSAKAIVRCNDEILFIKEGNDFWDLPGGGVEHDEEIFQALARELAEETGIEKFHMQNVDPIIAKMVDKSADRPLLFLIYLIDISTKDSLKEQPEIQYKWVKNTNIDFDDFVPFLTPYTDKIQYLAKICNNSASVV